MKTKKEIINNSKNMIIKYEGLHKSNPHVVIVIDGKEYRLISYIEKEFETEECWISMKEWKSRFRIPILNNNKNL